MWLGYIIIAILAIPIAILIHICFISRYYTVIDKKLYVKHGRLGKWIEVDKHMIENHRED